MTRQERFDRWWRCRSRPAQTNLLRGLFAAWTSMTYGSLALVPAGIALQVPLVAIGAATVFAIQMVGSVWKNRFDRPLWERAAVGYVIGVHAAVVGFIAFYWSLSDQRPGAFSEPLSKVDAAYFTAGVFSTTGFGDIVARSQQARLAVALQMGLGFAAVVVGIAMLFTSRPSTDSEP